jgi:hypothetical protein
MLMQYRKARKVDTGPLMFRDTAIVELLRTALAGLEPPKPIEDRLCEIEIRLTRLESSR